MYKSTNKFRQGFKERRSVDLGAGIKVKKFEKGIDKSVEQSIPKIIEKVEKPAKTLKKTPKITLEQKKERIRKQAARIVEKLVFRIKKKPIQIKQAEIKSTSFNPPRWTVHKLIKK